MTQPRPEFSACMYEMHTSLDQEGNMEFELAVKVAHEGIMFSMIYRLHPSVNGYPQREKLAMINIGMS